MRKSLAAVTFALSLLLSSPSAGATFIFSEVSVNSLTVELYLTSLSGLPVAAIAVTAPDTVSFTIDNALIAPFGSGSSFTQAATPGLFSLNLNPLTCAGINCVPFVTRDSVLLGTFQTPTAYMTAFIGPDDGSAGGTIFDAQLSPYNVACGRDTHVPGLWCETVVPEPAVLPLLALGVLALQLFRGG